VITAFRPFAMTMLDNYDTRNNTALKLTTFTDEIGLDISVLMPFQACNTMVYKNFISTAADSFKRTCNSRM
jgi:hypothetical protein